MIPRSNSRGLPAKIRVTGGARGERSRELLLEPFHRVVDDCRDGELFPQGQPGAGTRDPDAELAKPFLQTLSPRCACIERPYRESERLRHRPETIVIVCRRTPSTRASR